jgi:hypothetical protein
MCDEERKMLVNCAESILIRGSVADLDMEAHRDPGRAVRAVLRNSPFAGKPEQISIDRDARLGAGLAPDNGNAYRVPVDRQI